MAESDIHKFISVVWRVKMYIDSRVNDVKHNEKKNFCDFARFSSFSCRRFFICGPENVQHVFVPPRKLSINWWMNIETFISLNAQHCSMYFSDPLLSSTLHSHRNRCRCCFHSHRENRKLFPLILTFIRYKKKSKADARIMRYKTNPLLTNSILIDSQNIRFSMEKVLKLK